MAQAFMSRDSPVEIGDKIISCWENSNKGRLITSQPFLYECRNNAIFNNSLHYS